MLLIMAYSFLGLVTVYTIVEMIRIRSWCKEIPK